MWPTEYFSGFFLIYKIQNRSNKMTLHYVFISTQTNYPYKSGITGCYVD